MLACPACDSPNEVNSRCCVRCGATLPPPTHGGDFPPKTFGRTMLGVVPDAPKNISSANAAATRTSPAPNAETLFSPIEPSPATLTGTQFLNASASAPTNAGPIATQDVEPPIAAQADPMGRTLMGFGADFFPHDVDRKNAESTTPPGASANAARNALRGTLMGVSPFAAEHYPTPERSTATSGQGSAPDLGTTVNVNLPQVNAGGMGQTAAGAQQQFRTMLGVAPPMAFEEGEHASDSDEGRGTPAGDVPQQPKGTLLGVAMPGIAPLNPGVKKPEAQPDLGSAPQPDRVAPVPRRSTPSLTPEQRQAATLAALEAANRVAQQQAIQRKRLAWILGTAATLLLAIIAVAGFFWWSSVRLTVKVGTTEGNQELLIISCGNCQAGTSITLQGKTARFLNGKAELAVPGRLSVGMNRLPLEIKRPNRTRSEIVTANVPVEFRVSADLSGLFKDTPQLLVQVEALPQTRIQLDGRMMTVGNDGKLIVPIDVTQRLTGPSSALVPFEYETNYIVTLRDGTSTAGSLSARIGVSPLEISAPGIDHVTPNATFSLAGRTSAKAKITANGHPIAVAPDGTFRQDMALSAPGATRLRVRAQEDGLAPRIVDISLERVTNLQKRAEELGRSLFTTHEAITNLLAESPNSRVALHGEVVAIEVSGPTTTIIVSASCVRGPCLATVRHGAPLSFKRGDRIIAIGHGRLTKRASGPERDLSIDASLVVEESPR